MTNFDQLWWLWLWKALQLFNTDCDGCERQISSNSDDCDLWKARQRDVRETSARSVFPEEKLSRKSKVGNDQKYLDDDEDNNDEDDDDDQDDEDDDDEEVDEEMLLRFNTCAVVSSAGSLKDSGLGAFIDSHDIVIRWNIVVKWNVIKIS